MVTLPEELLKTAANADEKFRAWALDLPSVVAGYAARWDLRLGEPYQPGGANSWVAPASDQNDRALVLKVSWRHYEAEDEAAALGAWAGRGAVRVFAHDTSATTTALLLERCDPGTPLRELPEPEQDEVLTGVLRQLWQMPTGEHEFRPLSQMCQAWTAGSEAKFARTPGLLDAGLVRDGLALFRQLPAEPVESVLLCTDLHAGNVLAAQRRPWLVIDPKPYRGDPCYDVLQHLLNCERLFTDPRELVRRVAGLAGLDADRVQTWLFARCVHEAAEQPALRPVAAELAP
ncbi:aminoglycoside phosphotransferase family protein [Kineosporia rhizophila]|uniref:aminoglycoside phosphotransferase family protein n=1 Tax=Kineosporia TaxID=49184 RepID=UPI001E5ABD81|nr:MULTISPECIES: aminoglycoside phosphotransferase family protein [Kineosporia]MCE0536502.1 aminoglycoside phosphotransferase family protein [Kineosporia rhizophila]GLY15404.1 streptomycin 6-kinase [Kineosporia sp. NBRC 101677]